MFSLGNTPEFKAYCLRQFRQLVDNMIAYGQEMGCSVREGYATAHKVPFLSPVASSQRLRGCEELYQRIRKGQDEAKVQRYDGKGAKRKKPSG